MTAIASPVAAPRLALADAARRRARRSPRSPATASILWLLLYAVVGLPLDARVPGRHPADRQRAVDRRDLRPHRPRLHDGLRDHRAHQLRPRRHLHGRRVPVGRVPRRDHGPDRARVYDPVPLILAPGRRARVHDADHRPAQRRHRAVCLPTAAERPATRTADHRHRRVVHPAERRPRSSSARATAPRRRSSRSTGRSRSARRRSRSCRSSSSSSPSA